MFILLPYQIHPHDVLEAGVKRFCTLHMSAPESLPRMLQPWFTSCLRDFTHLCEYLVMGELCPHPQQLPLLSCEVHASPQEGRPQRPLECPKGGFEALGGEGTGRGAHRTILLSVPKTQDGVSGALRNGCCDRAVCGGPG